MKHERHGMRWTKTYKSWLQMKDRCLNPRCKSYKYYGGRGISVCERWRNSFKAFYADMGDCPPNYTLDRIDNARNYSPENCRWADRRAQANNTRANHILKFRGKSQTLKQWERETGIDYRTITDRLNRRWSTQQALTSPVAHRPQRKITFNGRTQSMSQWAREVGISSALLAQRLYKNKWTFEKALTVRPGDTYHNITYKGRTQALSEWSREIGIQRSTIRRRLKNGLPLDMVFSKNHRYSV